MISPGDVTRGAGARPAHPRRRRHAERESRIAARCARRVARRRGASSREWFRVCLELETCGGQEKVHVWASFPATPAFRRARSSSTAPWHTRTSARAARSDDSCEATEISLSSEHVRPQQSSCVGVALPVSTRPAGAMMTNRPRMRRARQPLHCRGERAAAAGAAGRLREVLLAEVRQHRHFLVPVCRGGHPGSGPADRPIAGALEGAGEPPVTAVVGMLPGLGNPAGLKLAGHLGVACACGSAEGGASQTRAGRSDRGVRVTRPSSAQSVRTSSTDVAVAGDPAASTRRFRHAR